MISPQKANPMLIAFIIIIIMSALAVLVICGKGDNLIAGYNTYNEEERKEMNIQRLRIVVAMVIFLTSILVCLPFLLGKEDDVRYHLSMCLCSILVVIIGVLAANTWCKKK